MDRTMAKFGRSAWLLFGCTIPVLAQTPLRLEDLERMALAASPVLAQSDAEIRSAAGLARQAGAYPNPVLGASGDHVAGGPDLRGGDLGGFVEQRIVTGGKLGLARSAADQRRRAAEQMREAGRLRVLTEIRSLYYQALGEQRLLELRKEMSDLAGRTAKTLHDLNNLGQADRPDQLSAEVESQRAELAVTLAQNALDRTWGEIAAMLSQPSLPAQKLEGDFEAVPKIDATALQRIKEENPEIKAADFYRASSDFQLRRERAENIPDIQLRGGVRYNRELLAPGYPPIGIEGFFDIGVEVPLFHRREGQISAAQAQVEKARLDSDRERLLLARRFAAVYKEYQDAAGAAARYRGQMLPAARQAFDLYSSNFAQMAAPYAQVLSAQRNLFALEEDYISALLSAWRSSIEINGMLVGPVAAGE